MGVEVEKFGGAPDEFLAGVAEHLGHALAGLDDGALLGGE